MTPIAGVAARHGLLLWEDCAQVFTGMGGYLGHPESDAAFFSFGAIKRATALGGGIARIRDAAVLSGMIWRAYVLRSIVYGGGDNARDVNFLFILLNRLL